MKKLIYPLAFAFVIGLSAFTLVNSVPMKTWVIDDNHEIKFTSADPTGVFNDLSGDILFDPDDLGNSMFDMAIQVSSINTGNGMQNQHAKSDGWFEAKKYPEITFKSDTIVAVGDNYKATGNLFIHGVTNEFVLPFTWTETPTGGLFTSEFDINRRDYEIGLWNDKASDVLRMNLSVPVKH